MGRGRTKLVTVFDVADRAGVSPGTVSKALNGRGQLSAQTRQRVVDAATSLGFQPNGLAKSLLAARSYMVGVLITDSIGRFTIPLLAGAEDVLGPGQTSMPRCESRGDPIREQHYIRTLQARRVDGIIVTGRSSDQRPSLRDDVSVPVVYALVQSDNPADASVLHHDRDGASMATRHLLQTGVGGLPTSRDRVDMRQPLTGWPASKMCSTLRGEDWCLGEPLFGEWSEHWGREAAVRLHRSGEQFDGVFCASDQIARGLVDGLREVGRRVPEEVGVVGMDNWDVMVHGAQATPDHHRSQSRGPGTDGGATADVRH